MEATLNAVLILVGYLLGSVPFAYLTTRVISGQDIRKAGSGNVGALNVYQNAGLAAGIGVLAADAAKGALAVLVPVWAGAPDWVSYASGAAAVAGHNWPVFLGFRGGKGAATILGIGLALAPYLALMSLAPILVALVTIRNMVVGVAASFLMFNVLVIATGRPWELAGVCIALTLMVVGGYLAKTLGQTARALRHRRWRNLVWPE